MKLTVQTQLLPDAEQAALKAIDRAVQRGLQLDRGGVLRSQRDEPLRGPQVRLPRGSRTVRPVDPDGPTGDQDRLRRLQAGQDDPAQVPQARRDRLRPADHELQGHRPREPADARRPRRRALHPGQVPARADHSPKGQSDLVLRDDGKWFLLVTVDVPDAAPIPTTDFIGVDLGIANIATDSDGERQHSGKAVDDVRRKHNLQRKRLQRKGHQGGEEEAAADRQEGGPVPPAREPLHLQEDRRDRQAHRSRDCPRRPRGHPRTGHGSGRGRTQSALAAGPSPSSARSWRTRRAGGRPRGPVDPAYTSRTCPECGHCERSNREEPIRVPLQGMRPRAACRCRGGQRTSETPPWCKPGLR